MRRPPGWALHALLAAVGIALAIVSSSPETTRSEAAEAIVRCDEVDVVRWRTAGRRVEVRRDSVIVTRGGEDGAETTTRYDAGDDAVAYLDRVARLDASRTLPDADPEALSLVDEGLAQLDLECGAESHALVVGVRAFGRGDRYVRADDRVHLLTADVFEPLDLAELRLVRREVHDFDEANAARAEIETQSRTLRLVQRNRRDPRARAWVDAADPATRVPAYDRLLRGLRRIRTQAPDEPPETAATILIARYHDADDELLGRLELRREGSGPGAVYYVREDARRWHRTLTSGAAAVEATLGLAMEQAPAP